MKIKPLLFSLAVVGVFTTLAANGDLRAKQKYSDFTTVTPIGEGEYLVIGFPGGREKWTNTEQIVVRIANRLRTRQLPGVHIEVVENKRRKLAIELVRRALDRNQNSALEPAERDSAKIILYGQSMGGAAVVKAARDLEELGVPILRTVQIDSVGLGDGVIPANVLSAANLYQRNGKVIRGESAIRAEDPSRTQILGNFRYDYKQRRIDLPRTAHVKWYKRLFWTAHTQMEFDPDVWRQTEELILTEIKE